MKIHVSELEGAALSYAVAMAQGYKPTFALWCGEMVACEIETIGDFGDQVTLFYEYHDRWDQCGQLIEKYNIWLFGLIYSDDGDDSWKADVVGEDVIEAYGETPKIAICRAVVLAKIGEEVEIPDELVG